MIFGCDKANDCNLMNIKDNMRFYINDLGLARYLFKVSHLDESNILGMLSELFVAKRILHSQKFCTLKKSVDHHKMKDYLGI